VNIVKSGTDFEEFSDIKVELATREVTRTQVLITEEYKPDPEIVKHIASYAD
jgi:hypothetical protein